MDDRELHYRSKANEARVRARHAPEDREQLQDEAQEWDRRADGMADQRPSEGA